MQNVFISYSHLDDLPFGPDRKRWVNTFEEALQETLGQRVGQGQVRLWRDKRRMDGATKFDDVIRQELKQADLLITVLSQHYLDSDYCRDELRWFGSERLVRGGLHVGTHSRIVKVYRAAIERARLRDFAELPELATEIDSSEGFRLFCPDGDDYRDALLHPDGLKLVWQKADDLAATIKRILDEHDTVALPSAPPAARPVVYLARCARDMLDARDKLRRELEDLCTLLPDGEAPEDAQAYADAVRTDLARSQLSIHLLGQRYGAVPDGSTESGVAIQAELALACQHQPFATLIWSPPAVAANAGQDAPTTPTEPRMHALREQLRTRSLPPERAEYVRETLPRLTEWVLQRLRKPASDPAGGAGASGDEPGSAGPGTAPSVGGPMLYLICDRADREDTKPLKLALEALGLRITRPPAEGTPKELDDDHKRCLVVCDVAVVVWGKVREPWVRKKLSDLQQAAGWGRKTPLRAAMVLVGPPDTPAKHDFDLPEGVIRLAAAELPAALAPLID